MSFLIRWIIRFFGIFVFARGCWMLWNREDIKRLVDTHRGVEGEVKYLDSSVIHYNFDAVQQLTFSSAFLLTLSGLIIITLSFRR